MFPSASALSEGAMREGFAPRRTRAARFRKRLPLISLSFVRSLTRLEGLLVRRGGKKKEEEKREKRKKKTKREREKGKAREEEEEEDKQRFFYQRGESWLCVW